MQINGTKGGVGGWTFTTYLRYFPALPIPFIYTLNEPRNPLTA